MVLVLCEGRNSAKFVAKASAFIRYPTSTSLMVAEPAFSRLRDLAHSILTH